MKRKNRDTPGRRIAQAIIAQYKPKSVAEMQAALKEVFGPMFEAMLNGETESYLGYEPNFPARKKRRRTGVTATSTRLSKRRWARQQLRCPVIVKPPSTR